MLLQNYTNSFSQFSVLSIHTDSYSHLLYLEVFGIIEFFDCLNDLIWFLHNAKISPRDRIWQINRTYVQCEQSQLNWFEDMQFCLASLVVHKVHIFPLVSVIAWDDVVTETF